MGLIKKSEPQPVQILDKPYLCPVCNNHLFYKGKAQLNSVMASFLNLDFLDRSATYISCSRCRHIDWFKF